MVTKRSHKTNSDSLTLSVEETSRILGISRAHAYQLVNDGTLPSVRLGRRRVISRVALQRMLEAEPDSASG